MQTVLTIAGFDPSSGAGVTADLMVFAAHSLFGTACITALTVQSTLPLSSAQRWIAWSRTCPLPALRLECWRQKITYL
jgi:hydroxymethylpyrimidine/phosphomethylpyrimidine kinase